MPIFAEKETPQELENQLQNQINQQNFEELQNQLDVLQNTNNNLESKITELQNKIATLEDHGIKFSIDEENLAKTISENQLQWREGDLVIASSTIVAFFGFSAFLTMRFTTPNKSALYKLLKGILYSIFGIQITHLVFIGYVIIFDFHYPSIILVFGLTVSFLVFIVKNTKGIFYLEYRIPEKNKILKQITDNLKSFITEKSNEINKTLDQTQLKSDETEKGKNEETKN